MAGSNISGDDTHVGDVIPVFAPTSTTDFQSVTATESSSGVSTISGSGTIVTAALNASHPHLVSPKLDVGFMDPMSKMDKQNEIVQGILDSWLESIHREADRIAEELRSPNYKLWLETLSATFIAEKQRNSPAATELAVMTSPDYIAWVGTLNPMQQLAERNYQQSIDFRVGLAEGVDNYSKSVSSGNPEALAVLPFMAATFVVGHDVVSQTVNLADVSTTPVVSVTGFDQIWEHVAKYTTDDLAELGLIGALFASGVVYQTTVENIGNPSLKSKSKNLEFANRYAKNIIQLVLGTTLDGFVRGMLAPKTETSKEFNPDRQEELVSTVKIVLLAPALALLYKIQTGKITGKEFLDMVNGTMVLDPNNMDGKIVHLIRYFLGTLPEEEATKLLNALSDYMDKDPSIDNMLDPGHVFEGLLQNFRPVGPIAA